jgi:hypothetical protein
VLVRRIDWDTAIMGSLFVLFFVWLIARWAGLM